MNLYEPFHAPDNLNRFAALQFGRHIKTSQRLVHPDAILIGRTLHRSAVACQRRGSRARPRIDDDEKAQNPKEPFACAIHSSSPIVRSALPSGGGALDNSATLQSQEPGCRAANCGWAPQVCAFAAKANNWTKVQEWFKGRAFPLSAYPSP
jgi:hypothetical protein